MFLPAGCPYGRRVLGAYLRRVSEVGLFLVGDGKSRRPYWSFGRVVEVMARSCPGWGQVRKEKEEEEGVVRLVEEDRRREEKTGETLSVLSKFGSRFGQTDEVYGPYVGSRVAACPWPFRRLSMTVVDTAQTGKNAWPPAKNSSVLVGAPAQLSERSVSGSLRLPGTFHGLVRRDLKAKEESPFGRRRKTRDGKPGRRCQFLSKSEVRFGLKKGSAFRTQGMASPLSFWSVRRL